MCLPFEGRHLLRGPRNCWPPGQGHIAAGAGVPGPSEPGTPSLRKGTPRRGCSDLSSAQVSPEMNFNFRWGSGWGAGGDNAAGGPGRRVAEPAEDSADLNFKGSWGPSASALCDCVCGAGVSAHARLHVWRAVWVDALWDWVSVRPGRARRWLRSSDREPGDRGLRHCVNIHRAVSDVCAHCGHASGSVSVVSRTSPPQRVCVRGLGPACVCECASATGGSLCH